MPHNALQIKNLYGKLVLVPVLTPTRQLLRLAQRSARFGSHLRLFEIDISFGLGCGQKNLSVGAFAEDLLELEL